MSKYFELFDVKTGELAFTGSANECKDFLQINDVRQIFNVMYRTKDCVYRGYQFVAHEVESAKYTAAIRAWDAFVKPLRKKYGIAIYKGEARSGT